MRIANVAPVYPPKGGMGTVAQEYELELVRRGETVEVFTPNYASPILKWGNSALVPKLLWKLHGFDIIHLHYPFYGGAAFAALASILWRTPLVVTYHMKTRAKGWLGGVFRLQRLFIEPFLLRRAKRILVSSMDYAHSIGLTHAQVEELPFGVDAERFSPGTAPQIREHYGIPADAFVFLFVGGMDDAHYFKGVEQLLKAFARIPLEQSAHLLLAGDGNRRGAFEKMAEQLGLQGRVHFTGRVSAEELPDVYRSANAHILPSIDRSEAFGLVTLEAAASGLPSIVSDLPGVRTLVEDGVTGRLAVPGDVEGLTLKMRELQQNPQKSTEMGVAARGRVEKLYANEVIGKRLQDLYHRVKVAK